MFLDINPLGKDFRLAMNEKPDLVKNTVKEKSSVFEWLVNFYNF